MHHPLPVDGVTYGCVVLLSRRVPKYEALSCEVPYRKANLLVPAQIVIAWMPKDARKTLEHRIAHIRPVENARNAPFEFGLLRSDRFLALGYYSRRLRIGEKCGRGQAAPVWCLLCVEGLKD